MAKPIGIVAMLFLLLNSGPALADNHNVPMRAVDDIKVTNTNKIIFELKTGGLYSGELQMCPIAEHVKAAQNRMLGITPLTGRPFIRDGMKIAITDVHAKKSRKKRLGTCTVSNIKAG